MNDQHIQAYLELIDQLLSCSDGQESDILNAHQELLDPGLVKAMNAVAQQMQQQGNETDAQWLQNMAMQLANAIGLSVPSETRSGNESDANVRFFLEVLQVISDHKGFPGIIYQFFATNINKFNADLLKAIPSANALLLANFDEQQHSYIAAVTVDFANLVAQFPLGQRAINLELAIEAYQQTLQVMTRDAMPIQWATTMMNLASAYMKRIRGERTENIEYAIETYQQALQVRTRDAMPIEWATTMMNLANAYKNRIRGERADNIEQAINAYQQTLQVRTRDATPVDWAYTMMNLANAYRDRIRGERANNLERAIDTYQQALKVMTRDAMPAEWATAMLNLANAYRNRIRGERVDNLEMAIDAYQQALTVRNRDTIPVDWAQTMVGLANTYMNCIRGERADNIEKAIDAYQQALTVITRDTIPVDWATTMNGLAVAHMNRIRGKRAANLEQAIDTFQQALTVITRDTIPVDWATIMMNLATVYKNRICGERADNLEQAINFYHQALQVRTRDAMPVDWADIMHNLANAYSERIRGERADNLEMAIDACQQALQVKTRDAMPVDWAATMNNLASVYKNRIRGDRADNLEIAIDTYEQALQVMTRDAMPVDWAATLDNLATAYYFRIRGERANNLEQAIDACQQALQVRTRDAMPVDWAATMNNLAGVYSDRIRGNRAENLKMAIDTYEQALQVRTRDAMPIDWATSMMNLANAYSKHIQGNLADNLEMAIDNYQQALQVMTRDAMPFEWATSMMNLANTYSNRIRGNHADNLEMAIDAYQQALQVRTRDAMPVGWANTMNNLAGAYAKRIRGERADNIKQAIDTYEDALEVFKSQFLPNDCRRTAWALGNLYADQQCWDSASTAYGTAVEAAEILYQSALSRFGQEAELSETDDLFRRAAFAQAKVDQLNDATATLEQGRARGLRETLERDRADLSALAESNPEIHEQYQQAAAAVRQLELDERSLSSPTQENQQSISEAELRQRAEFVRQGLRDAITAIRKCPGYETFLEQPSFDDVIATVEPGQPLVYLLPTPNGGVALIVHQPQSEKDLSSSDDISPVWLDALTDGFLQELLFGPDEELGGWFRAYNHQSSDQDTWFRTIDQVTQQLWTLVMEPVVNHLEALKATQAVLIPTGYLSFLPLHAAWTEDATAKATRRYALDVINFTYVPNASSLGTARAIGEARSTQSLLAINEPRPTSAAPLPASEREVEIAVGYFKGDHNVLRHEQVTREAVLAALPEHDVLHFSCHGSVNFRQPLNSGLLMANNKILSLRDFFNTDLQGVRLAILSACETGLPGLKLPDEVVSLPTGLLQAGIAGVMASLWSVSDLSTTMLLVRFYDAWQNQELEPAQALHSAQLWLRDTSNEEKQTYFSSLSSELTGSQHLAEAARTISQLLFFADPMDHPFHWAAFTYVGV